MRYWFKLVIAGWLCLWAVASAWAVPLHKAELFSFTSEVGDWKQADAAWRAGQVRPMGATVSAGFGPPMWLALRVAQLPAATDETLWVRVSPYFVNEIEVYVDGDRKPPLIAGSMVSRSPEVFGDVLPLFPLVVPAHAIDTVVFVRVDTRTTRSLTVAAGHLDEMLQPSASTQRTSFFWGGVALTLAWVSLFAIRLRATFFYFYAAYLICIILGSMAVAGALREVLPPGTFNFFLGTTLSLWLPLTIETARITAPMQHCPRLFAWLRRGSWGVCVAGLGMALFGRYDWVSPLIQSVFPLVLAIASYMAWQCFTRGELAGRICAITFGVEAILALLFRVYNMGFFCGFPILRDLYQTNTYLHMVLICLALVARMQTIQRERERTHLTLIDHLRNAERALEIRVHERTIALQDEIVQRTQVERALNEANMNVAGALASERRALESVRDLFYLITHDLRTPLAILQNYFGFRAGTSEAAQRAVADMSRLVTDRLANADWRHLRGASQNDRLDLVDLLRNAVERARDSASAHKIDFFKMVDHLHFEGNAEMLAMMVSNVLNNAVVHTPDGTTIEVLMRVEGSNVLIIVQDDGCGVEEGEHPTMFQQRWRGKSAQGHGAGLGLYLVERVAVHHGGSARAEAVKPHGLRIVIMLPISSSLPLEAAD